MIQTLSQEDILAKIAKKNRTDYDPNISEESDDDMDDADDELKFQKFVKSFELI